MARPTEDPAGKEGYELFSRSPAHLMYGVRALTAGGFNLAENSRRNR